MTYSMLFQVLMYVPTKANTPNVRSGAASHGDSPKVSWKLNG